MDLVIWRHAEAYDTKLLEDDLERSLTSRGQKQAARMALWLDKHLPDSARVWSSPARRAEQTALALGRKYKIRQELAPDRPHQPVLDLLQWPHGNTTVLLVGHQPMLGLMAAQILGLQAEDCAIKKAAVWWLRARLRENGVRHTTIWSVQNPDTV